MGNGNGSNNAAGLDFLDFLFTFTVGVGLVPEAANLTGLLSESWVKTGTWPSVSEFFDLAVFFLALLTLVLSWYGYHASIQKKPLTYGTVSGMCRFVIDVFLVMFYGVMLLQFKRLEIVLILMMISFVLFTIWDIIKIWEHQGKFDVNEQKLVVKYRREMVTFFWTVLSVGLFVFSGCLSSWVSVGCAILITICYRLHKQIAIPF